jgi:hypothetical protein
MVHSEHMTTNQPLPEYDDVTEFAKAVEGGECDEAIVMGERYLAVPAENGEMVFGKVYGSATDPKWRGGRLERVTVFANDARTIEAVKRTAAMRRR